MRWLAALFVVLAGPAAAVDCADVDFDGASYAICTVDVAHEDLRLFHRDTNGDVYGHFGAIKDAVGPLKFAMNAGMYHDDRSAVGLYRENGQDFSDLVLSDGPGNFGLLPNGVFCLNANSAFVVESRRFAAATYPCDNATQSGPMLVIDGALHPRFIPNGSSKHIRNGVGVAGTTVYFAISNEPVNFHSFGRLFRDYFRVDNALYFDGKVSRLYAPALNRSDFGWKLGPIVGVVE